MRRAAFLAHGRKLQTESFEVSGVDGCVLDCDGVEQSGEGFFDECLVGASLEAFFRGAGSAREFGEGDDLIPAFGGCDGDEGGVLGQLLVGPEGPSDVVLVEQGAEFCDPFVGVLSGFAEPEGDVIFCSEIDEFLDGQLFGRGPVGVKGVGGVGVEGRAEDGEVGIPLGSAEEEDVVGSMGRIASVSFL